MATVHDVHAPAVSSRWWWRRLPELALAAVIWLPLLLTQRGTVGADTKTYLYLDPSRLLAEAPYLWDPGTGLGTVTHQNIGYLWPSGPFYWLFETIGAPDWLAQRIWLGAIMVTAGIGVLSLLRQIGWAEDQHGNGRLGSPGWWNGGMALAAFAYALSPYLLDYSARLSVILLPWAALPWFVRSVDRALERGGWRDPAVFALIVLTVGAINATSLFLVGLGPLLWLIWRGAVERSVPPKAVFGVVWRIGVLTLSVSAWWLAGLVLQGAYSVPIVRYTETYQAIAVASTAPEVIRGLGYWFFYGNDKLGQWVVPSIHYMRLGLPVSFALPTLALTSAALLRFRRRGFFLALFVVGAIVAVGGHPYDDPSPAGAVLRAFTRSDLGLAFRSTPRAIPLLILATSVLLGAGLNALSDRLPRQTLALTALALLLVALNLPGQFVGQMVDRNLRRPEQIPTYWQNAADHLDDQPHETRVLELPGTDFAAYRWGNTVDPITPGLIDRPYVARELIPLGSPASANLVNAIDRPLQEGTFDPESLGPLARLVNAGDVVLRSDLEYERFRTPRPEATWDLLKAVPGLEDPLAFGEPRPNDPAPGLPLLDEVEFSTDPDLEDPPPVAVFPVQDPTTIVRALPTADAVVLAGDGDGVVAATGADLIDPDRAILYSADLLTDPELAARVFDDGAEIVVTDSNRRRARRWGTIRENEGYTEQAGESPIRYDPSDNRLDLFPEADDAAATVSVQRGGASVTASAYGNPVTFTPGDRAVFALDGNPRTAWKVGAFSEVTGEFIRIDLDEPTEIDHLTLTQPTAGNPNRWITEVQVRLDGNVTTTVPLDERSRSRDGQRIDLDPTTVQRVEIEITDDNVGFRPKLSGISAVGFSEIGIADIQVEELIRPPIDITRALGPDLDEHGLSYVLQRLRNNPAEPVRDDEEPSLRRILELPTARTFDLRGEVRLSPNAADITIDRALGIPSAEEGGITTSSSDRLEGDLVHRSRSAFDGDPETAWNTPFARGEGQWLEVQGADDLDIADAELQIVTDARHSVPTAVAVSVDGGAEQVVELPDLPTTPGVNSTTTVPLDIESDAGTTVRFRVAEVEQRTTVDWYSGFPVALPVGIAEVALDGLPEPSEGDATAVTSCRLDLLRVDDRPVGVRLGGTLDVAASRGDLTIELCDDDRLDLDAGSHDLESAPGTRTGFDLDRLVLVSPRTATAPPATSPPAVSVDGETRVSYDLSIDDADEAFWLVLGQSRNEGWTADITGGSLSDPTTISGFANGWYVTPDGDGPVEVQLEWAPQRLVWFAAVWSILAVLLCLAVLLRRGRNGAAATGQQVGIAIEVVPFAPEPTCEPTSRLVVLSVLGAAAAAAIVSPPAIALLTGGAVFLALTRPTGPSVVRLAAPVLYALIAGYVMIENVVERAPVDFAWPAQFEAAHWPGVFVVLLVAIELGLTVRRRRRA